MGFRFQRHVDTGLGRINMSRSGISLSEGFRGAHVTIGKTPRITLGIPGSGLSWTETLGSQRPSQPASQPAGTTPRSGWQIALIVIGLLVLLLIIATGAHAQPICDLEHQCFHGDLAHPDRVTPPPVAQYPRSAPPPSQEPACHLVTIREAPQLPARIVEICALSPDRELSIRQGMAQPPVTMIDPPWRR
jgi:Protein of unknown function (DUF4236)